MSLRKWLSKTESGGSSSDQRALEAAAEAVEALQQEREELECKERKSERHYYDQATNTAIGLINDNITSIFFTFTCKSGIIGVH